MKIKCLAAVLCFMLAVAIGASAGSAPLNEALSALTGGEEAVSMTVSAHIKTLMPFDEIRLDMINRVLSHTVLTAQINETAEEQQTAFQLTLGGKELLEISEQYRGGAYLLQSSLLPNRTLFSTQGSPMDTLLAVSEEADTVTRKEEASLILNTSDVTEAFDFLAASDELEGCYRALIDQTVPLTKKNTPNYGIKNIGKGRISYVAKLTTEQSGELLSELRTVLSCGMDAAYRAELAQVTFAGGFVVALYQNKDGEDICVYIRGTMIYPDGDERALKWQWAFTPDRETQTFTFEAARESGTRDSRVIDAILKRTEDADSYSMNGETVINLRRSSENETSTYTIDLRGKRGDAFTCKGDVERITKATSGGESIGKTETKTTVDLSILQTNNGAELFGTATYADRKKDTLQTELEFTFTPTDMTAEPAQTAETNDTVKTEVTPSVMIQIIPADVSDVEQSAQIQFVTVEETQREQPEFLVGAPPMGLYDYQTPPEMTTVSMDNTASKVHQSLINEAAQRLAGHLVLAMLDLPEEDRVLLSDGMTEEDYAVFLAMRR